MRSTTLLLALALSAAAFAALPSAEASPACTPFTHDGCGGLACVAGTCVTKNVLDTCHFQSDCCSSISFWCPEDD